MDAEPSKRHRTMTVRRDLKDRIKAVADHNFWTQTTVIEKALAAFESQSPGVFPQAQEAPGGRPARRKVTK